MLGLEQVQVLQLGLVQAPEQLGGVQCRPGLGLAPEQLDQPGQRWGQAQTPTPQQPELSAGALCLGLVPGRSSPN